MLSLVQLFAIPWTLAYQAALSIGILQTRILEWVAIPSPGDLPDPWIKPRSHALQADSLPSEPPGRSKEDTPMSNKHQKLSLAAREMQIKTTVSYQYTPVRMAKINKTDHAKYWPGCIEIETLLHCLWKYKMAQQP